jgi:hypothetical protein
MFTIHDRVLLGLIPIQVTFTQDCKVQQEAGIIEQMRVTGPTFLH